jgi:superfamily II DNA or RNA helicase
MSNKKEQSRKFIKANCELMFMNGRNLLLTWCTGTGKSLAAINLQSQMNSQKTFICVAEIAHIQNWKDEYIKHGFEELLKTTEIFCYASLKKYANKECDLLILDEAHHVFSEARMFLLTSLKTKRFIGLSATISDEHKYFLKDLYPNITEYEITLEQAIEMELIPKPVVNIMLLDLNNTDKTEIIEFTRGRNIYEQHCDYSQKNAYIFGKDRYGKYKYPTLNLKIHCTQQEKYNYLNELYERARITKRMGWLRHGSNRKKFLSDCKLLELNALTQNLYLQNKRFICFCGSIEQAEILGGSDAIHSKKDAKKVLERFNSYETNSLYAIGMLVEGVSRFAHTHLIR